MNWVDIVFGMGIGMFLFGKNEVFYLGIITILFFGTFSIVFSEEDKESVKCDLDELKKEVKKK